MLKQAPSAKLLEAIRKCQKTNQFIHTWRENKAQFFNVELCFIYWTIVDNLACSESAKTKTKR